MPQAQTMTLDEKLATILKAIALDKAGDEKGSSRLIRTIPMPPYLAEAEAEFGSDWLSAIA